MSINHNNKTISRASQNNSNPSSSTASDPDRPLPLNTGIANPGENFTVSEMQENGTMNTDENDETLIKVAKNWKRYLGLILAILSSLMFSINALIFKLLNYNPPLTPAIFMFLGTTVLTLPFYLHQCWKNKKINGSACDISWRIFVILLTRGLTGCSGMLLFFYSLQYMSIGDALVIACSSPVFVFLLAFLFLKENCGIVPILTIILALIGTVIITRPPLLTGEESFKESDLIGASLAFASMLSIASTLVLMRYLQNVHHSLINLVFGLWGTIQTLGLALTLGELNMPKNLTECAVMSLTGLIFFVGQSFLALALQLEEAGPVSLIRTSEVVFAFIWQILFLSMYPDLFSISGAILILVGILTTILRKWIASLPATHEVRKKLEVLLK